MPRYYFDVVDSGLVRDDEGLELSDVETAREEAIRALPDLAKGVLPSAGHEEVRVTVRDRESHAICEASLTIRARWLTEAP